MRKTLLPMIASLALCGAATVALIATNARAEQQSALKPVMIAQTTPIRPTNAAPPAENGQQANMVYRMDAAPGRICKDLYARKAGELAFLEAKLSLDARQAPLFARWKQASLDIARQHESDCAGKNRADLRRARASVLDRMTLEEGILKRRLADIQTERPALTALYNGLTPAQKEEFGRGGGGRFHMMLGMMDRPHPGMGMMRQGPMTGPMNGPTGGPSEPPPPAQ
jgi:hypothetical protein